MSLVAFKIKRNKWPKRAAIKADYAILILISVTRVLTITTIL